MYEIVGIKLQFCWHYVHHNFNIHWTLAWNSSELQ